MHEQYEPRDCVSCMRLSRLVSGRRVPQCVPTSCMCLTYVNMHSPKPPHSLHTSPHARYAPLPHLHVNPPPHRRHLRGASSGSNIARTLRSHWAWAWSSASSQAAFQSAFSSTLLLPFVDGSRDDPTRATVVACLLEDLGHQIVRDHLGYDKGDLLSRGDGVSVGLGDVAGSKQYQNSGKLTFLPLWCLRHASPCGVCASKHLNKHSR